MGGRIVIVVAHPDDEIIGAGNLLAEMDDEERRNTVIVYGTAGVPRDMRFSLEAGCADRNGYADARRRERDAALSIAGVRPDQCVELGCTDQEMMLQVTDTVQRVARLVSELRPKTLLTHPYEGGHPDHDTCAFACRRAVEMTRGDGCAQLREFACYHGGPQGFVVQSFLPADEIDTEVMALDAEQCVRKQRMFDCHQTQKRILALFSTVDEKFRPAPEYDFSRPPHPGPLHYETLGWGIAGSLWRDKVREAMKSCRSR